MNGVEPSTESPTDLDARGDHLWSVAQRVDLSTLDDLAVDAERDEALIRNLLALAMPRPRPAEPTPAAPGHPPASPEAAPGSVTQAGWGGHKLAVYLLCITMVLLEVAVLLIVIFGRSGNEPPPSKPPTETPKTASDALPAPNNGPGPSRVSLDPVPKGGPRQVHTFLGECEPLQLRVDRWARYWSSFSRGNAAAPKAALDGWAREMGKQVAVSVRWDVVVESVSEGGVQLRRVRCPQYSAASLCHAGVGGGWVLAALPETEVLMITLSYRELWSAGHRRVAVKACRFPFYGRPHDLAALRPGDSLNLWGRISEIELDPPPGGDPSVVRPCGVVLEDAYVFRDFTTALQMAGPR